MYIYVGSDPLVHLDYKSLERATCKLMLSGEQNMYIEEQTTQWPNENIQKDKHDLQNIC
jgi:hypothetical protein